MNPYEQKVRQFHVAINQQLDMPLSPELLALRKTLIAEEVSELFAEIDKAIADLQTEATVARETHLNLLKEMADVQYVLSGMSVTFGFKSDAVFDRVHKSNMSKLGDDGKPILREDGKAMKGPNYHPPMLADLI